MKYDKNGLPIRYRVTWRTLLEKTCEETGEDFNSLTHTMTEEELDEPFWNDYGEGGGCRFTAWGQNYVYFPATYDGKEWAAFVPRNPCGIKTPHVGGS